MLRGQRIVWCEYCGRYYTPPGDATICPVCGQRSFRMRCSRCGHEWMLRSQKRPKACPAKDCKSIYWDRARMQKGRR